MENSGLFLRPDYTDIENSTSDSVLQVIDHMYGFDHELRCSVLDNIVQHPQIKTVVSEYILSEDVRRNYPGIDFRFSPELWHKCNRIAGLHKYNLHPELNFKNFVCSFNGSPHASRKLLVSILERFKYFDPEYCSKNFSYTVEELKGIVHYHVGDMCKFYNKFFIDSNSETFFQTSYSFGHDRVNHGRNIYNLENKLTESFVHIVSETLATSYYPFVTEKFLYSVVTRGLFLAYAQPGWHEFLEKYYGFKKYSKIFDYSFDSIQNPVERLISLMTMLSKFQTLTADDWRDIYQLERDTIEYNYECFFSKQYLGNLYEPLWLDKICLEV